MSKTDEAFDVIHARILNGQYPPGARIVADVLARELSLSVGPIREAIRRLEAQGYIQYVPHVGAIVAQIEEQRFSETLQVKGVLEALATGLSAPHLTEEDFERIAGINVQMREAAQVGDVRAVSALNQRFHEQTYRHCRNEFLRSLIATCWERMHLTGTLFASLTYRPQESVVEHEQILALLRARAPSCEIERAVRLHKERSLDLYLQRQARAASESVSLDGARL